eukprot:CAMPEP_0172500540 /NCGR_PEP_ID=MMETSP1066-20121228/139788_1 /TAXON_ID=671091 /ORGANISM="Coscinodiscus wailesii, Strain CCMP2513" /LENGTH=234 /DNA_ID=CAMNT_0013274825 /DNA_START=51 /DNA_END=752 /DNA_ORIENTATION=-
MIPEATESTAMLPDDREQVLMRLKIQQSTLGLVPDTGDLDIISLSTEVPSKSNPRTPGTMASYSARKAKFMSQRKRLVRITSKFCICMLCALAICGFIFSIYTQQYLKGPLRMLRKNPEDTKRFQYLKSSLLSVTERYNLEEKFTPQYKALLWLSKDDPLRVPVPTTESQLQKLIQRYVLACLYYSTGGPNWNERHNFLSGMDECDWNQIDEAGYYNGAGGCGIDGRVTMIALW